MDIYTNYSKKIKKGKNKNICNEIILYIYDFMIDTISTKINTSTSDLSDGNNIYTFFIKKLENKKILASQAKMEGMKYYADFSEKKFNMRFNPENVKSDSLGPLDDDNNDDDNNSKADKTSSMLTAKNRGYTMVNKSPYQQANLNDTSNSHQYLFSYFYNMTIKDNSKTDNGEIKNNNDNNDADKNSLYGDSGLGYKSKYSPNNNIIEENVNKNNNVNPSSTKALRIYPSEGVLFESQEDRPNIDRPIKTTKALPTFSENNKSKENKDLITDET